MVEEKKQLVVVRKKAMPAFIAWSGSQAEAQARQSAGTRPRRPSITAMYQPSPSWRSTKIDSPWKVECKRKI